ncbi:MAG: YHS domain-containing protein [Armatimonadetes bacterium]|nr:YHS domain-containing protein [Armatimonadota bacterium]
MITAIVALVSFTTPVAGADFVCPIMVSHKAKTDGPSVVYAGATYRFCCGGCPDAFAKNPAKYVGTKEVSGDFLFDPTTGKRVDTGAGFTSDYKGLRFHFATKAGKATFDKNPAKYGTTPKMEVMKCAVMGDAIPSPDEAYGYVDFKDTRYYVCCAACMPKLVATPAKYAAKVKAVAAKGYLHAEK